MKKDFFISVIVCLYNQRDTFPHILSTLAAQNTDTPYEIVLADDGSNAENLTSYISAIKQVEKTKDVEIKLAYQTDKSFRLSQSRNNGLNLATGNVVIFLDGDVIPDENLIEHHVGTHQNFSSALVFTNRKHKHISEIGIEGDSSIEDNIVRAEREKDTKQHMREWQRVWGFNMSFSRPLNMKKELQFNEKFVGWGLDDAEFSYRLKTRHGYQIICNENVNSYHINPDKIVDNPYKTLNPADLFKFVNNAITFIEEYDLNDEIVQAVLPTIPKYDPALDTVVSGKSAYLLNEKIKNPQMTDTSKLVQDIYALREMLSRKYA